MALEILDLADPHTLPGNQSWSTIDIYALGRLTAAFLNCEQVKYLTQLYNKLYRDLDFSRCMVPHSFRRCTSVIIGNEIFGTIQSRNMRNSMIIANLNNANGKIIDNIE